MLPDPLHPALVHFPIVFMVVLPLAGAAALWAIRRGTVPRRAWVLPLILAGAVTLSAWAAVQTGEAQEEAVEAVVPDGALDTHEEAAERFLLLSIGVFGIMAVGLAGGRLGAAARGAGIAAALALGVAGYQVGHSGGELVYRHGAASAYVSAAGGSARSVGGRAGDASERPARERFDDDDSGEEDHGSR